MPDKKMDLPGVFYKALLDNINEGVYFVDVNRKIMYWNRGAENITGFSRTEVTGKCCAENILRHIDEAGNNMCQSQCPLSKSINDGKSRKEEAFFHHRDGRRVPVEINVSPIKNSSGKIVGAVEIFRDNSANHIMKIQLEELEKMTLIDNLTKIANRKYLEITLSSKIEQMKRYGQFFGLLFIDIDRFKSINDEYGHDMGDKILIMVAGTIRTNIRFFDVAGRWGGEEFLVIFENISAESLLSRAEKLRMLVGKSFIRHEEKEIGVTISIGGTISQHTDTAETILKRADKLMYKSKASGRNCTTLG